MKRVIYYTATNGKMPVKDWLNALPDETRGRIFKGIRKVAEGGAKNRIKSLKDGVFEIKFDIGPGYRVYFGEKGNELIVLLVAGNKKTQKRDIEQAKVYWRQYGQSN